VVNPRRARRLAESLGERNKTDPVDAGVLCEYATRMPWVAWQPPSSLALRLRAIEALGVMHTQEINREHALATSQASPAMVIPSAASTLLNLLPVPRCKSAADQPRGQSPSASCTVHAGAGGRAPRASATGLLSSLRSRGKARLQAVVAVMRKLLHSLFRHVSLQSVL
jgi:hypothetical protein